MSICLSLRPATNAVFKRLDTIAANGDFDADMLLQIKSLQQTHQCRSTIYYLASLFLQIGEEDIAHELLASRDKASAEMKRFFGVLSYSLRHGLPIPKLKPAEESCLEYLDATVNPKLLSVESVVLNAGGFSIVGNAPGAPLQSKHDGCRFYFNSYQDNTRISNTASIHVVTPSWSSDATDSACSLCVTGNNIFYRRSRVWQKFVDDKNYPAIYTVPRHVWRSLYKELGSSPSAGLLILGLLERIAAANPQKLVGFVAGFSSGRPQINHGYDKQPPSMRHNWEREAMVRARLKTALEQNCKSLVWEE